jgi:hypothetical protein
MTGVSMMFNMCLCNNTNGIFLRPVSVPVASIALLAFTCQEETLVSCPSV